MSLKGRIEAVIYAAEEPVTLPQLLSLLGVEAGEELDRLRERQGRLELEASEPVGFGEDGIPLPSEPDLLNDEVLAIEDAAADGAADEASADRTGGETVRAERVAETPAEGETGTAEQRTERGPAPSTPGRVEPSPRERERAVREYVRAVLGELQRDYAAEERGIEIREIAGGYRFATKPEYHDAVRGFAKSLKPPLKLSLQALETLAVVAYKQPVTAPEVSEIRGVDSGGVLGSLLARKLVTTAGRKPVIGRPILYKTTKDFLLRFGLKDTSELPSIEEFEKMAGELAEPEEEMPMRMGTDTGAESPHADPELVRGVSAVPVGAGGPGEAGDDVLGTPDGGGSIDEGPVGPDVPEQSDVTEPQADGDSTPTDEVIVDGRIGGVTPAGSGDVAVDSSAGDAAIRRDEERDV